MIKLDCIISIRNYNDSPSFQIVFEWEDVLIEKFPLKLKKEKFFLRKIYYWIDNLKLTSIFHILLPNKKNKALRFIMTAESKMDCTLNKNIIPVIIDFWLQKEEISAFNNAYKNCPLVLITSAEVFEYLKANNCSLNIKHWPLSFPDKYKILFENNYKKDYDLCFIGRPNPFFKKMLELYEVENPDFTYIISKGGIKNRKYYTNKGLYIGKDTGRDSYLEMIRRSKITCYSTPGVDEAKKETNRFNQVTPRLFEMIYGGCYIIGHYTNNPDTKYYKIEEIIPNVNNYIDFTIVLNKFRSLENQNLEYCSNFLQNHYTSTRIQMLKDILK